MRSWNDRRKFYSIDKDNSGYSIVELIIVIAIMAIVMGSVFLSVILIFSANAKTCANDIQRSIADCKVTTMGKSEAYMELWRDADGNIYTQMHVWDSSTGAFDAQDRQKVGTKKVYVGYVKEGEADTDAVELLAGGSKVKIQFDRASGSFDEVSYQNCAKIIVQGGSKNYAIELVRLTGKSSVTVIAPTGP